MPPTNKIGKKVETRSMPSRPERLKNSRLRLGQAGLVSGERSSSRLHFGADTVSKKARSSLPSHGKVGF
jgi:hypothetical protein